MAGRSAASVRTARRAAAEAAAADANSGAAAEVILPVEAQETDGPTPDPAGPDAEARSFAGKVNTESEADADETVAAKPKFFNDDKRKAIGKSFRENRARPAEDDETIEDFLPGADDAAAATAAAAGTAADEGGEGDDENADQGADDAATEEFIVNGKRVKLSKADQRKIIQQNLAGEEFLAEAKTARTEARAILQEVQKLKGGPAADGAGDGNTSQARAADTANPDRVPGKGKTKLSRQQLLDAAEKIQAGLAEDGADALESLLETVASGQQDAVPQAAVAETWRRSQEQDAILAAVENYATKHPGIAKHKVLSAAAIDAMMEEALTDFAKVGMPPEDIDYLRRAGPEEVVRNFVILRAERRPDNGRPWGLRSYDQIIDAAVAEVGKVMRVPEGQQNGGQQRQQATAGSVDVARRVDAKRGLTSQPSAVKGNTAGGKNDERPQAPPAKRGSDIVKQMRQSRHQLVMN